MDSALFAVGLPLGLVVVMFGLGLSLTLEDFRRVIDSPKAVVIALACQVALLPVVAFGLVLAFDVAPLLAVGFMVLAASPGGAIANLYSHLFRGDVALNITITAINSILALLTLPLITNLALGYFGTGGESVGLQVDKLLQIFPIVLVPVAIGMVVRGRAPQLAARTDGVVRAASVGLLVFFVSATIVAEREDIVDHLSQVGLMATLFCAVSLAIGYGVPRVLGIGEAQAIASGFEVGIHNSTLALTMAISVLESTEIAVPVAIYGVIVCFVAAAFGFLVARTREVGDPEEAPVRVV